MINVLQLYGALVLTLVGFIVPILTILISLFPDGIKHLSSKYENEKKQSEENIANEIKKRRGDEDLNYVALEKTLQALKEKRQEAEAKLRYLRPGNYLARTSIPFILAFAGILVSLLDIPRWLIVVEILASVAAFAIGVRVLIIAINVLFEVSEMVNQTKLAGEAKIVELLSSLVDKTSELYIKKDELKVKFNGKTLAENAKVDFNVDKQYEIPVAIHNVSDRMAKKVEVGLILPSELLIEKNEDVRLYTDEYKQIARFNREVIHAHESNNQRALRVTFLQAGEFKVEIFIKGENVQYTRFAITLNVVP